MKLLGIPELPKGGLNQVKRQLINWLLTTARCALHKSAVDYRVRAEIVPPRSLFVATAKSHIMYEYKRACQRRQLQQFEDQWCTNEALATLVNEELSMKL